MEGEQESPTSSPAPNQQQHPAPVEELGDEYKMMGGVIGQSRKLITKYARREFTDKVTGDSQLKVFILFVNFISCRS